MGGYRGARRGADHPALRADRHGTGADDACGAHERSCGCAASGHAARGGGRACRGDQGSPPRSKPTVRAMTLDADELEADAREQTGLSDFGDGYYHEGLARLVAPM